MTVGSGSLHSGIATLVGRPNVGKSTLLNQLVGTKVSIVSDRPQTTRNQVRGVWNGPGNQIVFIDTPGIHKPKTELGRRLKGWWAQLSLRPGRSRERLPLDDPRADPQQQLALGVLRKRAK